VQLQSFPDFVHKADELALSFDDWLEMSLTDFAGDGDYDEHTTCTYREFFVHLAAGANHL
jgi:hypothetical protein